MKYRKDIDGLRAVAVVPVVLFHANVPGFGGGFVGVDIFFVISGFLITNLLLADPGLLRFYERRARRILPALFFMLASCAVAGWFIYLPKDLDDLGQSIVATCAFASNILFYIKSGYFDTAAETKALLHTWSLGVEEQFYVLFPVFLFILRRLRQSYLIGIALMALASFILSVWGAIYYPSAAFYLLPTRAWELLLGAMLVFWQPAIRAKMALVLGLAGILFIGFAVTTYSSETLFPGVAALLPSVGAALVILSGSSKGALSRVIGMRPMVFVGLISYSLYLWHWPILVFSRYVFIRELSPSEVFAALCVSVAMAILSWRFVERPFRAQAVGRKQIFAGFIATGSLVTAGLGAFVMHGIPSRLPGEVVRLASFRNGFPTHTQCSPAPGIDPGNGWFCKIGTGPPTFAIWGDSLAGHLEAGVRDAAKRNGVSGYLFTANGCPPVLGIDIRGHYNDCRAYNRQVMAALGNVKIVVLAGAWSGYKGQRIVGAHFEEAMAETLKQLQPRRIYVIAEAPGAAVDVPSGLAREALFNRPGRIEPRRETNPDFGPPILSPRDYLCAGGCKYAHNGNPIYSDYQHLTPAGSLLLSPLFDKPFKALP